MSPVLSPSIFDIILFAFPVWRSFILWLSSPLSLPCPRLFCLARALEAHTTL